MHDAAAPARTDIRHEEARARRRFTLWLAAISGIGLVLRCIRLGSQSLWIDEFLSYGWIAEIDKRGFGSLLGDIHGPLHAAAIWLASRFSHSEASLRAPSMIAGALSVPALGLLARRLWGATAGIVAASLLAVSPFALYYSQEVRNYAFSILFAFLLLRATVGFDQQSTRRNAAWVGIAELAGIASNLNGLFFTIGVGAWGLLALRARRAALRTWCV